MTHFYNEEVKRIDVMDERWYQIKAKGQEYDLRSVTTFLESFPKGYGFKKWLKSVGFNADIIFQKAGEFGSAVHSLIEQALKGETASYYEGMDIKIWERFLIWFDWWEEFNENHKVEWSADSVEMITYDLKLGYAGTVDLLAKVDGEYELFDWKTGNYLGDEAHIQISAYAKSIEKQLKIEINECSLIWMPLEKPNKKGYRVIEVHELDINFDDFLHTQALYLRTHKNEKPKYKSLPSEVKLGNIS